MAGTAWSCEPKNRQPQNVRSASARKMAGRNVGGAEPGGAEPGVLSVESSLRIEPFFRAKSSFARRCAIHVLAVLLRVVRRRRADVIQTALHVRSSVFARAQVRRIRA